VSRQTHREEEGQTLLALLLVVVGLLFAGLLFTQVGSAADEKTQVQTATDSGAVAAAHELRDFEVSQANTQFAASFSFGALFAGLPVGISRPQQAACVAAQEDWSRNQHGSGLDCGQLNAAASGDRVIVDLTGPAGEVATGPAPVAGRQGQAHAEARIVVDHCPIGLLLPGAKAAADWMVDRAAQQLGAVGPTCTTPADTTLLTSLDLFPQKAAAAIGPPVLVPRAASLSFRVELVA
jgi:hypothetical protein